MSAQHGKTLPPTLAAAWSLPSSATLGSSVRATGIERELRRRMPASARKSVAVSGTRVSLSMLAEDADAFDAASAKIAGMLEGMAQMPVLPSELEDILSISASERHKWLKSGRLKSIGTRTVKMRGRAKAVTFHVFDPRYVEEVLDGDLPAIWREEDAQTAAENRKRASGKAAMKRAAARRRPPEDDAETDVERPQATRLEGWDAFAADGLLR